VKTNAGTIHVCGGKRKQSKASFTRPDWAFKEKASERAHIVRRMENQFVTDEKGKPLTCTVLKKKDG